MDAFLNDPALPLLLGALVGLLLGFAVAGYWMGRTRPFEPPVVFVVEPPPTPDEVLTVVQQQAAEIMVLQEQVDMTAIEHVRELEATVAKKDQLRAVYRKRWLDQCEASREVWSDVVGRIMGGMAPA